MDDRERKLFIGDSNGKITAINVKNGAVLRKFERHTARETGNGKKEAKNKEIITDLCYFSYKNSKILVSASRSCSLKIHDDSSSDPNKSRNFEMNMHKASVNGLTIKQESYGGGIDGYVASCSDDSNIIITNLTSYRLEGQIPKPDEPILYKKLLFLNPYDSFVAADSDGQLFFFAYSAEKRWRQVFTRPYMAASQTNAQVVAMSPVTAMAFDPKTCLLLLGDEFGNIEVWNCTIFIDKIKRNAEYLDNKLTRSKTVSNNAPGKPGPGDSTAPGGQTKDLNKKVSFSIGNNTLGFKFWARGRQGD